jgi:hypothetical protein
MYCRESCCAGERQGLVGYGRLERWILGDTATCRCAQAYHCIFQLDARSSVQDSASSLKVVWNQLVRRQNIEAHALRKHCRHFFFFLDNRYQPVHATRSGILRSCRRTPAGTERDSSPTPIWRTSATVDLQGTPKRVDGLIDSRNRVFTTRGHASPFTLKSPMGRDVIRGMAWI